MLESLNFDYVLEIIKDMTEEDSAYTLSSTASLCITAQCYNLACRFMQYRITSLSYPLTEYERIQFNTAYKQVILHYRTAFSHFNRKVSGDATVRNYQTNVVLEAIRYCDEAITVLQCNLLPSCTSDEASISFLTNLADFYRYRAEIAATDSIELSRSYYKRVLAECDRIQLSAVHPLRLTAVSHYAILLSDATREREQALSQLNTSFNEAIQLVGDLDEKDYRASTLTLEAMKSHISQQSSTITNNQNNSQSNSNNKP